MTAVQQVHRLHESTVQQAAAGMSVPRPRRAPRAYSRSSRVRADQVDKRIMAAAHRLAAARPGTRVIVLDIDNVLIA